MSGGYDRRPRREWEQPRTRRSAIEQIGLLRVIGLVVLLAGSFVVLNRKGGTEPTPPTSGDPSRIAVDTALAGVLRAELPRARLTTGSSDELLQRIREGLVVDAAALGTTQIAELGAAGRCSGVQPIAERGAARYAACLVNAQGASRALGTRGLQALTSLTGRAALLDAGFDVPEVRPTTAAATSP